MADSQLYYGRQISMSELRPGDLFSFLPMNQVLLIAVFILAMANLSMPAPAQAWLWLMRSQVTGANVITEPPRFIKI